MKFRAFKWNKLGDYQGVWQDYVSGMEGDINVNAYYLDTNRGRLRVIAGDWIVEVDGTVYVMPEDQFKALYGWKHGTN